MRKAGGTAGDETGSLTTYRLGGRRRRILSCGVVGLGFAAILMSVAGQGNDRNCVLACTAVNAHCPVSALARLLEDLGDAAATWADRREGAQRTYRLCVDRPGNDPKDCGKALDAALEAADDELEAASNRATKRYFMKLGDCAAAITRCMQILPICNPMTR